MEAIHERRMIELIVSLIVKDVHPVMHDDGVVMSPSVVQDSKTWPQQRDFDYCIEEATICPKCTSLIYFWLVSSGIYVKDQCETTMFLRSSAKKWKSGSNVVDAYGLLTKVHHLGHRSIWDFLAVLPSQVK